MQPEKICQPKTPCLPKWRLDLYVLEHIPVWMCLNLGTARDAGLPRVTLRQRVLGLGAGTDGAPEGEIQKLTSSFILGRRVHMSPIEDESLLISPEHSEAAGMK